MRKLNEKSAFVINIILPLITMLLWGSLFPCIKIGYAVFKIDTENIADILMFASLRFIVCGAVVCVIAFFQNRAQERNYPNLKNIVNICIMGVFAIVLHYGFTYIGLSKTDSSKTAILKQIAPLLFSCFSFLFIKGEHFSVAKIIGASVGFCGIIAINYGTSLQNFSSGDILIISASVCTVISMIISGKCTKEVSSFWITGISQLFGGVVLLALAVLMNGKIPVFTIRSALVFAYICLASIIGYTLFYYAQRTADLSKLFIIKFAEPLFACFFGAVILNENILKPQYLIAFALISLGIVLGNIKSENK